LSNYRKEAFTLNTIFRALDDPTRRRILELLRVKDLTAGEIADEFAMTKPSISHHLDILKQAGVVVAIRKGQYQLYSLNMSVMQDAIQWLLGLDRKGKPSAKK
jgi:ArsR family transcriptional regulator, arsenate/arsenite/antimonite-responsive transcriptional repressor